MASEVRRHSNPFVSTPSFYSLCLMAQRFGSRPSAMLGIKDEYTAYCLDEAGAFLMAQPSPPKYSKDGKKKKKAINRDRAALQALKQLGAQVDI